MYRYAQVEDALLKAHELREETRGALRARIKNLQRLGVSAEGPGKGARIDYSFEDVCLLGLCLEFSQFGMDPTKILLVKETIWPSVIGFFESETDGEDFVIAVLPRFLTDSVENRSLLGKKISPMPDLSGEGDSWVFPLSVVADLIQQRALIINVSNLQRRIWSALEENQD